MDKETFDKIIENRIEEIQSTLIKKGKEYASNADRLYNFKRAAEIGRTTPEKALQGMRLKHSVSVLDLIEGRLPLTKELIEEKLGDEINYLILLEAVLKEKLDADR